MMKAYDYDCPIDLAMEVMGGKWKCSCLYYLEDGPKRFSELLRLLETASSRMLSKQLKELEGHDIIRREVFAESPPRVEYALTEYGKTLTPVVAAICAWGDAHLEKLGKTSVFN